MSDQELDSIATDLSGKVVKIKKSLLLIVDRSKVHEACERVYRLPGLYHLVTITGMDTGKSILLYYHFWKGKSFTTVSTEVPKSDPRLPSISDSVPAALLYEAEVKDMFGVTFEGNPRMASKLLLPDSYPLGAPPPLTKEADPEKIRKMMELE